MARFTPQPDGLGPIFPISALLVANRHPVCVAPHSLNSEKLAPSAAHAKVHNRLYRMLALLRCARIEALRRSFEA
jgi:hypothetical protein